MADLPDELLDNPIGTAELMKTILIDRRDNSDELAKKVELPKSRYFNTIDVKQRSRAVFEQDKKYSFLPKINSRNQ